MFPKKKDCELTESNTIRCFRQESSKSSFLPSVCGSNWPKKRQMPFAERMGKGKYPNLYTTCLVRSCFCLLFCFTFPCMRVFIMAQSHVKAAQKKVSKSSFSTTSANICNLCFSTYPARPIIDMGSTTIILRICVLYTTFSSRTAEAHVICKQLALQLVLQLLQRLQKRVPGNGANCCNIKFS